MIRSTPPLDADDVAVTVIPMDATDTPILINLGVAVSDLKLDCPGGGQQHLHHCPEPPARRRRDGDGQQPHGQPPR